MIAERVAALRPWERAGEERPFVYANMVCTVDGRAAVGGSTRALGGDADLEVLLTLRSLADAVLVGTETVRAEGYDRLLKRAERRAPRRARGQAEDPYAVLLTRSGAVPWEAGLFAAAEQPVLLYGEAEVPGGVAAPVEVAGGAELGAALRDLRSRGVRALLCEGGPRLLRALVAAGALDELFLTVAPLLTGDPGEPAVLEGGALDPPRELRLLWAVPEGDELFLRYGAAPC